jgi:hypothetical protein
MLSRAFRVKKSHFPLSLGRLSAGREGATHFLHCINDMKCKEISRK